MSKHRHNEYGQSWSLAAALLDSPKSKAELINHYHTMSRRFGIYMDVIPGQHRFRNAETLDGMIDKNLERLIAEGWIAKNEEKYHLQEKGRAEAEKMLDELERSGQFLKTATDPVYVSRVTLLVHALLAVIKLPAALISGSIGLLNDGMDTLLDSISSLLVHWGLKRNKERFVSIILLFFMLITGLYSLYEAVKGIIQGKIPEPDFLAFGAMSLSAILCGGLWFYQKFSGIKHQSLPLLTQSIDSKNHVIVAAGVAAGLIASVFGIPYIDSITGLAVSILILKGALELLIEIIRTGNDEELDLSAYGFIGFDKHKKRQFKMWLLYQTDCEKYGSWNDLKDDAFSSTDFQKIPVYRALGIAEGGLSKDTIIDILQEIKDENLIEDKTPLSLSIEGISFFRENRGVLRRKSNLLKNTFRILSSVFYIILFFGIHKLILWLQGFLPQPPQLSIGSDNQGIFPLFLITGAIFFISGSILMHSTRHQLHHNRLDLNKPSDTSLSQEGPYRFMRHPMYAGFMLIVFGICLSAVSIWGFIVIIVHSAVMIIQALVEDSMISKKIPEVYKTFKQNTPALILPLPVLLITVLLTIFYGLYIFL